jgi:hypothetical protein
MTRPQQPPPTSTEYQRHKTALLHLQAFRESSPQELEMIRRDLVDPLREEDSVPTLI